METYATSKGQIVIPSSVRRKMGIENGTRIQIDIDDQGRRIILTPITRGYVHSLHGKYRGKELLKAFALEKHSERQYIEAE